MRWRELEVTDPPARRQFRGRHWIAIAAAGLACGGDDASPTEPPAAPSTVVSSTSEGESLLADTAEAPVAAPRAPAATAPVVDEAESASTPEAAASTLESPSLDALLRVPPPKPPPPPLLLDAEQEAAAERARKASRFGVEIDSRDDPASVDGKTTRKQTDASVSVDVSDSTRVRGGVRVQENPEGVEQERVPTVGLEKRF